MSCKSTMPTLRPLDKLKMLSGWTGSPSKHKLSVVSLRPCTSFSAKGRMSKEAQTKGLVDKY
jgi:hypothetical protein